MQTVATTVRAKDCFFPLSTLLPLLKSQKLLTFMILLLAWLASPNVPMVLEVHGQLEIDAVILEIIFPLIPIDVFEILGPV